MSTFDLSKFKTYIETELGLSHETISAYTRDVKEFMVFIDDKEPTSQLVEGFINHLRDKGLKETTIRRKCMSVRCLCHHLISNDELDSNILETIDSIPVERRIPDALETQAVDILISTLEDRISLRRIHNVRRNVSIILTLYHSGLRVSELCNLNLQDINIARREIKVKGKGGRERVVPTTQTCVDAIRIYTDKYRQSETDALFVKANGIRISRRAVSDMLMSLSRRAGVVHTTAHMLRRSCATSLMNRGVDLELVQMLLGHKDLSTTQSYLAVDNDRLVEVHSRCHPFGEKCAI